MVNVHEKQQSAGQHQQQQKASNKQNENIFKNNDDDFFELLTRSQSKRMDDQRCTLKVSDWMSCVVLRGDVICVQIILVDACRERGLGSEATHAAQQ